MLAPRRTSRARRRAELQVSHFQDLVTLVNPRSAYTFVNYLHENGRLYHFLNAQFQAVLRDEFAQYLNWAFQKNPLVRGGETVREYALTASFACGRTTRFLAPETSSSVLASRRKYRLSFTAGLDPTCSTHLI
ncbi:SidA/IucD/PvdA family monooxygenase [Mesorhizobium sp.]|nr:SidA/IucD/PvdA family monooxygenase [Mesorhizobium sp.]